MRASCISAAATGETQPPCPYWVKRTMPNSSKSRTGPTQSSRFSTPAPTDTAQTPRLRSVVETALYINDLERTSRFYAETLQLRRIDGDARFAAFAVGSHHVLLLFVQGSSLEPVPIGHGGIIPPHDAAGPAHIAFGIAANEVTYWRERLDRHSVTIESEINWPRGGRSLFFRDPDGHLLELITPGVWEIY
ncbi:MAG: VOC family protein [Candidatus Methylacidiphilales bacterium]|nr:VOC family protein [Candidatus Methylacidiphilales bacterium]